MLTLSVINYIKKLTESYPQIKSIWLFGSRANNTAHPNSDWDFFIFGSENILESLKNDTQFNLPCIDLLVIYDNENFKDPWGEGKNGSLSDSVWNWKEENQNTATYNAVKPTYDENGNKKFECKVTPCKALRVYPK